VPFESAACENCGNERLRHLHRIRDENGSELSVGCVCAAKLCASQDKEIATAERAMTREDRRLKAAELEREKKREARARFTGWKKKFKAWVANEGEIRIEKHGGSGASYWVALGTYYKRGGEAKRAVEHKLFGDS